MTAINVFRRSDRISILTDGAGYTPDGELVASLSKCWPVPHLNAAVASRGPILAGALFMASASVVRSFDDMVARAPTFVFEVFQSLGLILNEDVTPDFQLIIAGFSESRGSPESYLISSDATDDVDAATASPLDAFTAAPMPSQADYEQIGAAMPSGPSAFNVERDGLTLMEVQRNMLIDGIHAVGCHATLTEIDRNGVRQRVLRRWNDQFGKPIRPEPFAAPIPLNRQQRRALARKGA